MTSVDHSLTGDRTRLVSIKEASAYLSVSESTVRRLVRSGRLPARRVGAQLRLDTRDLDPGLERESAAASPITGLPSDGMRIPSWAEERLMLWREMLAQMLPDPQHTQVVVIDRRGAKAFSMLRPPGYQWGTNLWHSTALDALSDDQVAGLFGDSEVVVFDEMVQRGRLLEKVRDRLARVGLQVRSICLVRRRSMFLDGQLMDVRVQPVEDLGEHAFDEASTFLSRLFDYCEPPLDPDHVLVVGRIDDPLDAVETQERLSRYGIAHLVWNRQSGDESFVAALTVDRPVFFDTASLPLPDGIEARWDGPCKIRAYISDSGRLVTLTFINFPTLSGSDEAWEALVRRTHSRYGRSDSEHGTPTGVDLEADVALAYSDVCTDLSLELLRQSVAVGFLDSLGVADAMPPQTAEMAAFFGRRRGEAMHEGIVGALAGPTEPRLALEPEQSIPLVVDPGRPFVEAVDPDRGQETVVKLLANGAPHSEGNKPITYRELLVAARPMEESAVSSALDGLIDTVRAKPIGKVRRTADGYEVARAFVSSEYREHGAYDVRARRRTEAVAVRALEQWLRRLEKDDETEIHVAKLFVNLVHDWGTQFAPLAIELYPEKHGMLPGLDSKVSWNSRKLRYFVRELHGAQLLSARRVGRAERYSIPSDVVIEDLLDVGQLTGHERHQVKSLVRAYALIQQQCKVTRPQAPGQTPREFSDPMVVLSSARNEKIAYVCALFEVSEWTHRGRALFAVLGAHAARTVISDDYAERTRREAAAFAQPAAFLFAKVSMYRAVPQLRADLIDLFERESVDAGDIILETVDDVAREATDYAITDSPVGLLVWAVDIVRPFSSFVRQVLTLFGLETDRRRPEDRTDVGEDGTSVPKDARFYAREVGQAVDDPSFRAEITRLAEKAVTAAGDRKAEAEILERTGQLFERLISILEGRIKTDDDVERERAARDERHRDLLEVTRWLGAHEALSKTDALVAVADFYNFVGFVTRAADLVDVTSDRMAQGLQKRILETASKLESRVPGTVVRVSSDTCVIACNDADDLFTATEILNEDMRVEAETWDRELLKIAYMRFGITTVNSDFFAAVARAMKIGDRHGFARGATAATDDAHHRLSPHHAERFERASASAAEEVIWVLTDRRSTDDSVAAA